ncbi:Serine threonine-kinase gad8 [Hyphodiscus hymeniophilus]|uniref:Serine threonine-kinase gad8 n=1 Tax=Hyphodiscus hymeniophilus TaxID=353542 RepID=A0A9P6VKZ8_9HELO|nr:Serine threonine-kinase gad8 [Hyphodiscus hymeniophilus]
MSWKLTKKLKETHLGPLANTFSRTPSAAPAINDKDEKGSIAGNSVPTNDNGIAASEAMSREPPAQPRPGILIVTLHEGSGFSLPEQYKQAFNNHQQNSLSTGNGFGVAGSVRPGSSQQAGVAGSYSNNQRPQTSGGGFSGLPTNHGRFSSKFLPYALLDFDKLQVFVNAVSGSPENPLWAGENTQYKFDVSRVTELAEFTQEAPTDSYVDGPMLSKTMQAQFTGWSYNRPVAGLGDAGGSIKDPSFVGSVQDQR